MKIDKLSVENFKGLKSIDLDPKKINLITGRNNTGKTSLLESIKLLFDPESIIMFNDHYPKVIRENKNVCEISGGGGNHKTILKIERLNKEDIWDDIVIYFIEKYLERIKKFVNRYVRDDGNEKSPIEWDEIEDTIRSKLENQIEELSPSEVLHSPLMLTTDEGEYIFVRYNIEKYLDRKLIYKDMIEKISKTEGDDSNLRLIESFYMPFKTNHQGFIRGVPKSSKNVNFMQELDPRQLAKREDDESVAVKIDDINDYIKEKELVDDFKSFNLNQLVFTKNGEKYGVPYDFMGDGFKMMVGILWQLLEGDYEDEVCLIEEPENHMHPGYTRELVYLLIDICREYNIQFFITTHDRDFIEAFFGENIKGREKEFLKKNFQVINMKRDYYQDFSYDDAEYQIEELLRDLRGI